MRAARVGRAVGEAWSPPIAAGGRGERERDVGVNAWILDGDGNGFGGRGALDRAGAREWIRSSVFRIFPGLGPVCIFK